MTIAEFLASASPSAALMRAAADNAMIAASALEGETIPRTRFIEAVRLMGIYDAQITAGVGSLTPTDDELTAINTAQISGGTIQLIAVALIRAMPAGGVRADALPAGDVATMTSEQRVAALATIREHNFADAVVTLPASVRTAAAAVRTSITALIG